MFILKIIFCTLFVSGCECVRKQARCFDCVPITSCETAVEFDRQLRAGSLTPKDRETFNNATCGRDAHNHIQKVCCSELPEDIHQKPVPASNVDFEETPPRRCFDCVSITSCGTALAFQRALRDSAPATEDINTFNNAICGRDAFNHNILKVCCSDFPNVNIFSRLLGTLQQRESGENFEGATMKSCFDCVPISSCESAIHYRERVLSKEDPSVSNATFYDAVCGYEDDDYKVCCSDFYQENEREMRVLDEIETHPNVRLLPVFCGEIDTSQVIGGHAAKLYEFPWMTLIAYSTENGPRFHCGGSVINSRYILTAAHCVADSASAELKTISSVLIGDVNLSTSVDCQGGFTYCENRIQNISVEKIITHSDFYGTTPKQADIALLRLKEPIDFTPQNAGPVCLPVSKKLRNARLVGKHATIAGWGATEYSIESNILLKVQIPIWSQKICHSYCMTHGSCNKWKFRTLCAGALDKDSCAGDSGGPLMVPSEYNGVHSFVQYGIVSHGSRYCGASDSPGVYTDVTKFVQWILDNIRE